MGGFIIESQVLGGQGGCRRQGEAGSAGGIVVRPSLAELDIYTSFYPAIEAHSFGFAASGAIARAVIGTRQTGAAINQLAGRV